MGKVQEPSKPTGEGLKPELEKTTGNPISDPMVRRSSNSRSSTRKSC